MNKLDPVELRRIASELLELADMLENQSNVTSEVHKIMEQISPDKTETNVSREENKVVPEKKKTIDDEIRYFLKKYSCFVRALVVRGKKETYNIPDLNKIVDNPKLFTHLYDRSCEIHRDITVNGIDINVCTDSIKLRSSERVKLEECIIDGVSIISRAKLNYYELTYVQREFVGLLWLTLSNFVKLHAIH